YLVRALARLNAAPQIEGLVSQENQSAFAPLTKEPGVSLTPWGSDSPRVMARRMDEWMRLHRTIAAKSPDVFFCPSNFLPWVRTPVPYVVTVHDMTFFKHPEALPPLRRWYWHRWTHRTLAVADGILTATEAAREDIAR